jgi:hypothetical protein
MALSEFSAPKSPSSRGRTAPSPPSGERGKAHPSRRLNRSLEVLFSAVCRFAKPETTWLKLRGMIGSSCARSSSLDASSKRAHAPKRPRSLGKDSRLFVWSCCGTRFHATPTEMGATAYPDSNADESTKFESAGTKKPDHDAPSSLSLPGPRGQLNWTSDGPSVPDARDQQAQSLPEPHRRKQPNGTPQSAPPSYEPIIGCLTIKLGREACRSSSNFLGRPSPTGAAPVPART